MVDFWQRYVRPDMAGCAPSPTRGFASAGVLIVFPALLYAGARARILETLSKVGIFFRGAKLGIVCARLLRKHSPRKACPGRVVAAFAALWYVASYTDIAWPWSLCDRGGVNMLSAGLPSPHDRTACGRAPSSR
jgi:SSS family solute:Na+ symporter